MADEFTKAALYGIRTFNRKVKEKIGMEKLIELLNEYETPRSGVVYKSYDDYDGFFYGVDCDGETEIVWSDSLICSKKFGFIKWLVENEKIDYKKLREERKDLCDVNLRHLRNKYINVVSLSYVKLLMLLAIQDEPIEFLIGLLK